LLLVIQPRHPTVSSLLTWLAIGSACLPYPDWRFPGWNRLSAGLHLDDFRKFFEDSDGGRNYVSRRLLNKISSGDSVGFGYEFASGSVFFTYNGRRLPNAFTGVYVPRQKHDVYAAIGVEEDNDLEVNFGTEVFRWKEGNDWAWKVEGHVGSMTGPSHGDEDEPPPSYGESASTAIARE
jgi:Ran-binding protein 9/10